MKPLKQVSEITISYHPKIKPSDRVCIGHSQDVYKLLRKHAFSDDTLEYKEYFKIVLLNHSNKVLGITTISEGGTKETVVDIKLVLQVALLAHSSNIILAHNHPGGVLQPSNLDDDLTKKIKNAAELMDIKLYDHLIITTEGFYSYADEGRLRTL